MPTLNTFRNNFKGVRPNRFVIEADFPSILDVQPDTSDLYIYVKAADLPGSTIGAITVSWQGRLVKFAGERSYADWVIGVYDSNVPQKDLRLAFENWIEKMDGRDSHSINYNIVTDWIVRYSDINPGQSQSSPRNESQIPNAFNKSIKLRNCFPVDISPITLSYDVADGFSEYNVQMAYDFWEPI
jgi:hypothetical protein